MKKNINDEKNINIMNRGLMIIMFIFVMISGVNALDLSTDQQQNIYDFDSGDIGNRMIFTFAGNINTVLSVENATNLTYYDYSFELPSITEDFYLILNNFYPNNTIEIMYRGDLTKAPILFKKELILNENGEYILKISPDYVNEIGEVFININDSQVMSIEYIESKPKGFNAIFSPLVNSFVEILDYNVDLWKILFYTLVFGIGIIFVGLVFGGAFMIIRRTKKLNNDSMLHHNNERSD